MHSIAVGKEPCSKDIPLSLQVSNRQNVISTQHQRQTCALKSICMLQQFGTCRLLPDGLLALAQHSWPAHAQQRYLIWKTLISPFNNAMWTWKGAER